MYTATGTIASPGLVANNSYLGFLNFGGYDGLGVYLQTAAVYGLAGSTSVGSVPTNLIFDTGGSERMRVSSDGSIGLGTTVLGANVTLAQGHTLGWAQSSTEVIPSISRQASNAGLMLGYGVKYSSTAGGFASSYASSLAKAAIVVGASGGGIAFYANAATTVAVGTDVTMGEIARITSGGLSIGRTSASQILDVAGRTILRANTAGLLGPVVNALDISYSGGGVMYGISLRPSADNTYPLYFSNSNGNAIGSVYQNTTGVAFNTTSDYRLKENVTEISDGFIRIEYLKPSKFNFINDASTVEGFIAHEVAEVVPGAVTGEKDAVDENGKIIPQQLDNSKLVPLLTAALKEAVAEIKDLKNRVSELERKLQ